MSFTRRVLPFLVCLFIACPTDVMREQYVTPVMGTDLTLIIEGADSMRNRAAAERAQTEVERINDLMSTWTETSPLSQLNHTAAGGWTKTDAEIIRLLVISGEYSSLSGGAFDVTTGPLVRLWGFFARVERRPPAQEDIHRTLVRTGFALVEVDQAASSVRFSVPGMELDFGAIAKGYAVDSARDLLRESGISAALVNLGGNISFIGTPRGRGHWNIAVRDPRLRSGLLGTLSLDEMFESRGIASSGQYERFFEFEGIRYGHIIDPRTGYPADGILGTTIIAPDATRADILSTATFVLGPELAEAFVREQKGVLAIIILPGPNGAARLRISAALLPHFTLAADATDVTIETF